MTTRVYRILTASIALIAAFTMASMTAIAQQPMPQTTKEVIKGTAAIKTERLQGTVEYVEGNTLLVRMVDGNMREFNVPETRKFVIDGRELTVHDLKPGTKLTATVTTTTTPVTERTTTIGTGKVWYVAAPTVILTLPNGENRQYKVNDNYKFNIEGREATVFELKKGMTVSAQKIVEEPRTQIASNTEVIGQAPPPPAPKAVVAQAPPPTPRQEVAQARPVPAPAPAPARAPVEVAQAQPAPAGLPATASNLPLMGVLGVLLTFGGLGLRRISRAGNV